MYMYKKYIKKILDKLLSLVFIIILIPSYIIISLLIIIIDRNNVIYKQNRTGLNGKVFKIYKFSTIKNDKVTKLGIILRTLSLDEIPQFFNVLKEEMSIVGPRPWVMDYYENMTEEQRKRTKVLPGLIGLAQVNGRKDISIFDKINYDIEYVNNISFFLDLKIFIKSLTTIIKKDSFNVNYIDLEVTKLKENKRNKGEI